MLQILREYWNDESGLTTIEYMILLALIVIGMIVAFSPLMDATGVETSSQKYDDAVQP